MKQFDRLSLSDLTDATEDIAKRKPNSKQFVFADKRRLVQSLGLLHFNDGGKQKDIDLTPVDLGASWRIDQAPYIIEIRKDRLEFTYTSRRGGSVTVSVNSIGGPPRSTPVIDEAVGTRIRYDDIRPGLDIYLQLQPDGVRLFKVLKSPVAPTEFIWNIQEDEGAAFTVMADLVGSDSKFSKDTERRNLDLTRTVGPVSAVAGVKSYTITELFNGRASEIVDRSTRRREWKTDLVYPLVIDPDISETITTGTDDCDSFTQKTPISTWRPNLTRQFCYGGYYAAYGNSSNVHAGLRFQTIDLDNAVTIDLANLKVNRVVGSGTAAGKWFGDDVDDAATWATTNKPGDITKTTASGSHTWSAATAVDTIDVTTVVQELVDRAGWLANQDMAFAFFTDNTGSSHINGLEALEHAGTTPAILEIDFTGGAAPPTINLVTAPYIPA